VGGTAGTFTTVNHVSTQSNRLYTVTQFQPASGTPLANPPGRLYAVDVVKGTPQVAWSWSFAGPSGASPLVIQDAAGPRLYFDGSGLRYGVTPHPWMFGLRDLGSSPVYLWGDDLTAFGAPAQGTVPGTASRDPRGGLWQRSTGDTRLLRLDELSGALVQTIDVAALVGPGYHQTSPGIVVPNNGRPLLLQGAANGQPLAPTYFMAIDLTGGTLPWPALQLGKGQGQALYSEFPIVSTPAGPMIIAARRDGTVFGITAQ
jgi:hypothetical protein